MIPDNLGDANSESVGHSTVTLRLPMRRHRIDYEATSTYFVPPVESPVGDAEFVDDFTASSGSFDSILLPTMDDDMVGDARSEIFASLGAPCLRPRSTLFQG